MQLIKCFVKRTAVVSTTPYNVTVKTIARTARTKIVRCVVSSLNHRAPTVTNDVVKPTSASNRTSGVTDTLIVQIMKMKSLAVSFQNHVCLYIFFFC